jgi:hypothetical protein
MRISHVIRGQRPVTAEMALLFAKAFGQTPRYRIKLRAAYDLKIAGKAIGRKLAGIHRFTRAQPRSESSTFHDLDHTIPDQSCDSVLYVEGLEPNQPRKKLACGDLCNNTKGHRSKAVE